MAQSKKEQEANRLLDFQIAGEVLKIERGDRDAKVGKVADRFKVTTRKVRGSCRRMNVEIPKVKPEPKTKAPKVKAPKVKKPASPPKPKPEAVKPPTSNGSGVKRMTREERKARRKKIADEIEALDPEKRRANLKEICHRHGMSDKVGLAACKEFDVALPKRTDGIPHRSFLILGYHLTHRSASLTEISKMAGVKRQRVHAVLKAAKDAKIPGVKLPRD